jgi:hypothetical protein
VFVEDFASELDVGAANENEKDILCVNSDFAASPTLSVSTALDWEVIGVALEDAMPRTPRSVVN